MPASDQRAERDRYLFILATLVFLAHDDRMFSISHNATMREAWLKSYHQATYYLMFKRH
jgi:hypothetical protein